MSETLSLIQSLTDLLTDKQLSELKRNISIHKYQKNELIYNEGDVPANLLCLLSGKLKVYKNGVGGRTQIIRVIKPVQYLGYRAYFANLVCVACPESRAFASTCMRASMSSMMRLHSFSSPAMSRPCVSAMALYFRSCSSEAQ